MIASTSVAARLSIISSNPWSDAYQWPLGRCDYDPYATQPTPGPYSSLSRRSLVVRIYFHRLEPLRIVVLGLSPLHSSSARVTPRCNDLLGFIGVQDTRSHQSLGVRVANRGCAGTLYPLVVRQRLGVLVQITSSVRLVNNRPPRGFYPVNSSVMSMRMVERSVDRKRDEGVSVSAIASKRTSERVIGLYSDLAPEIAPSSCGNWSCSNGGPAHVYPAPVSAIV